jgi:predicted AlkP superfamily phosphohydrolase/phosphomutase
MKLLRSHSWLKRALFAVVAAVILAGVAMTTACRKAESETAHPDRRVIVLGFDGMDWSLVQKMIDEGRLPHFAELARQGISQPLGTSIPPLSPVAWSNFITGMDAGGHGIFDFIHRDPKTMTPYLSTSRVEESDAGFGLGKWHIPLGGGSVELLRRGTPFWEVLHDRGIPTTVMRAPADYPPSGTADHELSGMGTPDILGTYGTFSFYSSDPFFERKSVGGGNLYPLDYWDDIASGQLHGPPNPFLKDPTDLTVDFKVYVDPKEAAALIHVGDEERVLKAGEWSDWVPVDFEMIPTQHLHGIVRFYLRSVRPEVELYASPINLDPLDPAQPISTPPDYAAQLAEHTGLYYTQGMPEDTKAATEGIFKVDEFLAQAAITQQEIASQYDYVLAHTKSGLLFYYFGDTDLVAHIIWRSMDPGHPAYDPNVDSKYANVIPNLYEQVDGIVGKTMATLKPDDVLIVMSDHGFASWRRAFNLNTWLKNEGYLVLKDDSQGGKSSLFTNVDWSRTRAYGIGFNGLYVNLAGREKNGIVSPSEKTALMHELRAKLTKFIDPATGKPAVDKLFIADEDYHDRGYLDVGPDMVVGYAKGTRCSDDSVLGEIPDDVIVNNMDRWSGDHSMDPMTVPGILFANRPLPKKVTTLENLAGAIVAEFGVNTFPPADELAKRQGTPVNTLVE